MIKKNLIILLSVSMMLITSCIKNDDLTFTGVAVEFDAASYHSKSVVSGVTKDYTLLTRVPKYGAPSVTSDPLITRTSGTIKLRVNLVGAQRASAEDIVYTVVAAETTAISGTHYTSASKLVIPAGSSFGELEVIILNPGATTTGPKLLVFELTGNTAIPASSLYKRIGISIAQT